MVLYGGKDKEYSHKINGKSCGNTLCLSPPFIRNRLTKNPRKIEKKTNNKRVFFFSDSRAISLAIPTILRKYRLVARLSIRVNAD